MATTPPRLPARHTVLPPRGGTRVTAYGRRNPGPGAHRRGRRRRRGSARSGTARQKPATPRPAPGQRSGAERARCRRRSPRCPDHRITLPRARARRDHPGSHHAPPWGRRADPYRTPGPARGRQPSGRERGLVVAGRGEVLGRFGGWGSRMDTDRVSRSRSSMGEEMTRRMSALMRLLSWPRPLSARQWRCGKSVHGCRQYAPMRWRRRADVSHPRAGSQLRSRPPARR